VDGGNIDRSHVVEEYKLLPSKLRLARTFFATTPTFHLAEWLKGNNNKTKVRQFNEFLEKIFSAKKENKTSFQLEKENAELQREKNLLLNMLSFSFLSYSYGARNKNKTLKKPIQYLFFLPKENTLPSDTSGTIDTDKRILFQHLAVNYPFTDNKVLEIKNKGVDKKEIFDSILRRDSDSVVTARLQGDLQQKALKNPGQEALPSSGTPYFYPVQISGGVYSPDRDVIHAKNFDFIPDDKNEKTKVLRLSFGAILPAIAKQNINSIEWFVYSPDHAERYMLVKRFPRQLSNALVYTIGRPFAFLSDSKKEEKLPEKEKKLPELKKEEKKMIKAVEKTEGEKIELKAKCFDGNKEIPCPSS
jgi:hypothetical protein